MTKIMNFFTFRFILPLKSLLETSKNTERHSELVSESPKHKEIADQVRNDRRV